MDVSHKDLELLQNAWDLITSPREYGRFLGNICLIQFLTAYFCDDAMLQKHNSDVSPDLQKALQYIDANLTSDMQLSDIARNCNMSISHFKTKFRMQLGITPLGYITLQKIERATKLLKCGTESVTDIANYLNFSSSNYFSSVFKQYTGYSPSEFRRAKQFDKT